MTHHIRFINRYITARDNSLFTLSQSIRLKGSCREDQKALEKQLDEASTAYVRYIRQLMAYVNDPNATQRSRSDLNASRDAIVEIVQSWTGWVKMEDNFDHDEWAPGRIAFGYEE